MKTLKMAWLIKTDGFPFNKEKKKTGSNHLKDSAVLHISTRRLGIHLLLNGLPRPHTIWELSQEKSHVSPLLLILI